MKKILVGFDGSDGAKRALDKAMSLINEQGELVILAVVHSPSDKSFVDDEAYKKLKEKAERLVSNTINDLGEKDFKIIGLVEEGDAAVKIIDTANSLNCELIVLGDKGTSEIGRYLLGSVANKVVQYAHKPVMIVR